MRQQKLRGRLEAGGNLTTAMEDASVHDVAAIVKTFFRDLAPTEQTTTITSIALRRVAGDDRLSPCLRHVTVSAPTPILREELI